MFGTNARHELAANDVIPLGTGSGFLTFLANDNGLRFFPSHAEVDPIRGGSGYFEVSVRIRNKSDAVALRLLGATTKDINDANDNNQ